MIKKTYKNKDNKIVTKDAWNRFFFINCKNSVWNAPSSKKREIKKC